MGFRVYVILFLVSLAPLSCFAQKDSLARFDYPKYVVSDKDLAMLIDKVYEGFGRCINDSVRLVLQIEIEYNAYTEKTDTVVYFELTPFFTWNDVGANYDGVLSTERGEVLLKEGELDFWVESISEYVSVKQKVVGDFGEKEDNGNEQILTNDIYPTELCIYFYTQGVFQKSKRYDCICP